MGLSEASESEFIGRNRRSSIRARSLLPCSLERVAPENITEVESLILDMSVLDSEYSGILSQDWANRADDLNKDVRYVLGEIRALRQQITSIERNLQLQKVSSRWVVINDRGLWFPAIAEDDYEEGDFLRINLQIPSLSSPQILALGEIIRIRAHATRGGMAVEFRSISDLHTQAITRYALKRERELARSQIFSERKL